MGLWKHLEQFFSPLFLLAPAAAASEPAPGQPEEFLRARKRRHAAALAEPFPGQLLVLVLVMFCKSSVCATPRFFYKAGIREGPVSLFTVDRRQSVIQELLGVTC
jgi:hypothetical protein